MWEITYWAKDVRSMIFLDFLKAQVCLDDWMRVESQIRDQVNNKEDDLDKEETTIMGETGESDWVTSFPKKVKKK